MMKDTNCGKECAFVKSGFCSTDRECPHFVQTLWQEEGNPTPKIVSDCYPKKFAIEQNQMLHRFLCMQSVLEELRFNVSKLEISIKQLYEVLAMKIKEKTSENLILDDKENLKSLE